MRDQTPRVADHLRVPIRNPHLSRAKQTPKLWEIVMIDHDGFPVARKEVHGRAAAFRERDQWMKREPGKYMKGQIRPVEEGND